MMSIKVDFNVSLVENEDSFAYVYGNPVVNWTMLSIYLLGYVSCAGLVMVSWFERMGQAGPYRTLVNQLVSLSIDQLLLFYLVGFGINNLRGVIGPMPEWLCKTEDFFRLFTGINIGLLLLCITATRFAFVCIYKSIPVMDDNFLATFIWMSANLSSLIFTTTNMVVNTRQMFLSRQCSGEWAQNELETEFIPIGPRVVVVGLIINVILNFFIWKNKVTFVQPFNHQGANVTNLGTIVATWFGYLGFLSFVVIGAVLNWWDIGDFNTELGIFLSVMMQTICPFVMVTSLCLYFFITKKYFRGAVIQLIQSFKNQAHSDQ